MGADFAVLCGKQIDGERMPGLQPQQLLQVAHARAMVSQGAPVHRQVQIFLDVAPETLILQDAVRADLTKHPVHAVQIQFVEESQVPD